MKKIILIIIILVFTAGCTNINKLSYDDIVNNITTMSTKDNIYRTGYSYYLPRGMKVADSTLYNEVIEDANSKYYLYVDVVSFYKKITKEYEINNNAIYSSKINYNDKFGYVEVNLLKNDKYLVEIMYNYAKIEVIVDKSKCKEAMLSIINILKSVEYNDSIIANLMGDDILNFNEEEFNIFNTKGSESNYLTVDNDYKEEEEKIFDPDLIN
ncbi:unknown [Firmicutes bacterium CAG:460]|nr:unknown [Firmicutes bacterium CAG:460]